MFLDGFLEFAPACRYYRTIADDLIGCQDRRRIAGSIGGAGLKTRYRAKA
jgi:hypothetical protein